jgi:hypothetical protein
MPSVEQHVHNLTVPHAVPHGSNSSSNRSVEDAQIHSPSGMPACARLDSTSDLRFRRPGDGGLPERIAAHMRPE